MRRQASITGVDPRRDAGDGLETGKDQNIDIVDGCGCECGEP
jgi:hypothetical protein